MHHSPVIRSSRANSIFFLVLGVVFIFFALDSWVQQYHFLATAIRTTGTVTSYVDGYSKTKARTTLIPQVSYVAQDNKTYTIGAHVYTAKYTAMLHEVKKPNLALGESVPIYYDPSHPENGRIGTFWDRWTGQFVTVILGLVCLLAGGRGLYFRRSSEKHFE